MAYKISDACVQCGACAASCPVNCISQGENKYGKDTQDVKYKADNKSSN